ncbi:cathepsin W [Candoia aspera]|uniref:cathepsin W n=1 Tax=Candoia aspera TaxID=51853 RepID=UPI002FD7BAA8
MWLANFAACLMLWGTWSSAFLANSTLPPDLGTIQLTQMFQDFMVKFNKTYHSQEEMLHRFKVFVQNLETSQALQDTELGTAQYGITLFSDLTESEFAKEFGNPVLQAPRLVATQPHSSPSKVPKSCDWRKAEAVLTVKYQGYCNCCWAFAAVSNVEALWKIHRNSCHSLSVQELIDCTYPSRGGCEGGFVWDALLYIFSSGLSTSTLYPYVERDQVCQKHRGRKLTKIDGYNLLPRDEKYIAEIVASQGPVTALMNQKIIQNYQKGIIQRSKEDCDPDRLDHAVLIVGFGEAKSRRGSWSGLYWIIQNSWGDHWGEQGYFRLHRGSNACGISKFATTAVLKNLGRQTPVACPP